MHRIFEHASLSALLCCRMMNACLTTTSRSEWTFLSRWDQCRLAGCLQGQL